MNSIAYSLYSYRLEIRDLKDKVHTFWEGHKILRNLHCRFVLCSNGQIYSGDFKKNLAFSEYMNFSKNGVKMNSSRLLG